ncbi:MarR family winged helix-turn-helix transcriptional regulator [Solimonas sp. K1W22B-7]|uniref:MarR family winged helix-turn-helix transcriptional regulator n=1 Tax=Solimonas sp. K1W22B-7 TaxID=2303331 RepID=UPI0013C4E06C|nr:helix-turn-helix domain-containing protein [Solimonas sp. K1W22B-7]
MAVAEPSRYFLMSGLLHAFYWMDEGLQNHLAAAGLPPVSRTQSLVMTNIADGVTRPAELARRLDISRQAVQQLLAGMQERGLIDLVADPDDARAKVVRYSAQGREIGKLTMRALERIDAELEKRLGAKALKELRRVLVEADWGEPVQATAADVKKGSAQTAKALEAVLSNAPKRRGFTGPRGS